MKPAIHISSDRRHFLCGAAAMIALPALESFAATKPKGADSGKQGGGPRNFVAIGTFLGWHQNAFYPKQSGKNYKMPPTLKPLAGYRDNFTVFSGLDHRAPGALDDARRQPIGIDGESARLSVFIQRAQLGGDGTLAAGGCQQIGRAHV